MLEKELAMVVVAFGSIKIVIVQGILKDGGVVPTDPTTVAALLLVSQ